MITLINKLTIVPEICWKYVDNLKCWLSSPISLPGLVILVVSDMYSGPKFKGGDEAYE